MRATHKSYTMTLKVGLENNLSYELVIVLFVLPLSGVILLSLAHN